MSSQWGTTGGNLTDFIWQYISQTATLYNWILKIETETKFATLLLKKKGKTEHSLSIGNWTSLRMNIQIFLWVSNGEWQVKTQSTSFNSAFLDILDGNSNSNHWKNQTLSPLKCSLQMSSPKMLPKRLQKCFKNATSISKCF